MKQILTTIVIVAACVVGASANAAITSRSKDIVVMLPADLPEAAQLPGQSMELHSFSDGTTYLYIEQQQVQRILVLDVTKLSKVKFIASVKLDIPAPFDFVRDLGGSAALVCYRDNRGSAVVDFQMRKDPVIAPASNLNQAGHTEEVGDTGFLMVNEARLQAGYAPKDYQVVDSYEPRDPRLIATVKQVQKKITDGNTGAVFLLGTEGLTVVRQPRVEEQQKLEAESN
jgi:hypothetical protein